MVAEIVVRKMGGSVGATLPKEMANRFNIVPGVRLMAIDTPDGILLKPYDENFAKAMEAYAHVARKYRDVLRELAK